MQTLERWWVGAVSISSLGADAEFNLCYGKGVVRERVVRTASCRCARSKCVCLLRHVLADTPHCERRPETSICKFHLDLLSVDGQVRSRGVSCGTPCGCTATISIFYCRLAETSGENATDDVAAQEVTEKLNRLKKLDRAYKAPSVDEPMPLRYVYSRKTNEALDERMVAEGRERELATLCSQDALFVITRTALRLGIKMVRGKFVDDMKNCRVKSRFVAVEVARDVRYHRGQKIAKLKLCHFELIFAN